jgi:uncharacterized protein (DUF1330 family)
MSAYVISDIAVPDRKRWEVYRRDVAAIVARHGGEYLVRGNQFEVLEGDWQPTWLTVIRFPDRAAAHAFLDDPDFQPLRKMREVIAKTRLIVVDGV